MGEACRRVALRPSWGFPPQPGSDHVLLAFASPAPTLPGTLQVADNQASRISCLPTVSIPGSPVGCGTAALWPQSPRFDSFAAKMLSEGSSQRRTWLPSAAPRLPNPQTRKKFRWQTASGKKDMAEAIWRRTELGAQSLDFLAEVAFDAPPLYERLMSPLGALRQFAKHHPAIRLHPIRRDRREKKL